MQCFMAKPWWLPFWKIAWHIRNLGQKPSRSLNAPETPDFVLRDLNHKTWRLYDFIGRRPVVLWMTNLCESCLEKFTLMNDLVDKYEAQVRFFAISLLRGNEEIPKNISTELHPKFPILLDPEDWVENQLGLPHPDQACPMFNFLVFDRIGHIYFKAHLSAVSEQKIWGALDGVLEQSP